MPFLCPGNKPASASNPFLLADGADFILYKFPRSSSPKTLPFGALESLMSLQQSEKRTV